MAPKPDSLDADGQRFLDQFASISFTGQKAKETLRNASRAEVLAKLIEERQLGDKKLDVKGGALVVAAASSPPADLAFESRSYVVERIIDGSLDSTDRVAVACKYMADVPDASQIDKAGFDAACGVGECAAFYPTCSLDETIKTIACIRAERRDLSSILWHTLSPLTTEMGAPWRGKGLD